MNIFIQTYNLIHLIKKSLPFNNRYENVISVIIRGTSLNPTMSQLNSFYVLKP